MTRTPLILIALLCSSCQTDEMLYWQPGAARVTVSDLPQEQAGRVVVVSNSESFIGLRVRDSGVGFGRSYDVSEWERLMAGETLSLGFVPGGHAYIGLYYQVRYETHIHREATSEQLTREGDEHTWTVEFGEATDSLGNVLTDEEPTATVTIVFPPEFRCSVCSGVEGPAGCVFENDETFQDPVCREAIERFDLIEHGFVDAEVFDCD